MVMPSMSANSGKIQIEQFHTRAQARMLIEIAKMSQVDAAAAVGMTRQTFGRIEKSGRLGWQDISGLELGVIEALFATPSGIAEQAQLAERELRIGTIGASIRARDVVARAKSYKDLSDLDILCVGSVQMQILIYEAKEGLPEQQIERLKRAHRISRSLLAEVTRAFAFEETGDDAARIVALRLISNTAFIAWELDEFEGVSDGSGARVQQAVGEISDAGIYRQTRRLARMLGDPRLAYQMADIAALNRDYPASASLLKEAIEITGQDPLQPRLWEAAWLHTHPVNEAQFEEVLSLIESPLFC